MTDIKNNLAVIVPITNIEESKDELIANIRKAFDLENINIVFINDNNKDIIKEIESINEKYAIFYNEGSSFYNVDFNKAISFMEKKNLLLYALAPSYMANDKIKKANFVKDYGYINKDDELYNLDLDSYIINTSLFKDLKINDNYEEDILIHILSNTDRYYQSRKRKLIKETKIIKDVAKYPDYNNKNWYLDNLKSLIKVVKDSDNHYVKNLVFNMYLYRLYLNCQQSIICILSDDEYQEFLDISHELLSYIDDDILSLDNFTKNISIAKRVIVFVLKKKYDNVKYEVKDDYLVYKDIKLLDIEEQKLRVNTINCKGDKLYVDCTIDGNLQEYDPIVVLVDGKEREYELTNIFAHYKLFGKNFYKDETIQFILDLNKDKKVTIKTKSGVNLKLLFTGVHSKLCDRFCFSYWNVKNKYIRYINNKLVIKRRNALKTVFNELLYWLNLIFKDGLKKAKHGIVMRSLYFFTLPKFKDRDIWITFDKIFKSGDCGEYFYRYAVKKHEIYYVLSPKAKFYKKLKDETKNVVAYGDRKTKLLALHSKIIFASDSIAIYNCGFSAQLMNYCKGLLNFEVHCIQHGLTMQDLAFRQNRLFDNIRKYYIASKYERKNLLQEEYGYKNEDIIDTGIPRFDGLQDKSENIILLIPTWRVNVASNISNDRIRTRNSSFKETEYFKIFNGFINNKKLIKLLKEKDYKVIFLIHPTLISNKDDYDKNDYVDIISAADVNYEDILTRAKIMITDYSGVQYDFAYMHKPIIYYHNPLLPPSYDDGMMNYKTMGFGEIVDNENNLINKIEQLLNNQVKLDKKYEDRINSFFLFDDYDNCKRIYEVNAKK